MGPNQERVIFPTSRWETEQREQQQTQQKPEQQQQQQQQQQAYLQPSAQAVRSRELQSQKGTSQHADAEPIPPVHSPPPSN